MAAERKTFETKAVGALNCDVVGNLDSAKVVILTVHDIGCNGTSWHHFVEHPSMAEVTKRVTWIHVNMPGHEDDAADLPADYKAPALDLVATAIGEICDTIHCPVVGLGEGAGANILVRLALTSHPKLLGAVLIHCTSTTAGFMESMKDKAINVSLTSGVTPVAEHYLVMHRFGDFTHAKNAEQVKAVVDEFHDQLSKRINSKNLRGYIDSFVHRTNVGDRMGDLKTPILLVTGAKASHNHTVHTLYNSAIKLVKDRKLIEFVEIVDVANVVEGAPEKLAESLLYFAQGCGVLGGAPMPGVTRQFGEEASMKKLDKSDL